MGILLVDGKVSCWHYIFQLISGFWHPSPFAAKMWMRRLVHVIMAFDGRLSFWRTIGDVCHVMLARLSYLLASCPPTQLFLNIDCFDEGLVVWHVSLDGPWARDLPWKGMVVVQTSMGDVYSRLWCLGCLKQLLWMMCLKQGFFNKCFKQCPSILKMWHFKSFKVWKTLPIKSSSDGMMYPLVK